MSDPERTPDILRAAANMPKGAAIIYRHFGARDRGKIAEALRQITFARGQQLLIGNDPELAITCGADGVHFRRDPAVAEPVLWRRHCPDWIITMAGIKSGDYVSDYTGNLSVLDGLLVSSVFESDSASAGDPMGIEKLQLIAKALPVPVIALGGINSNTAPQLIGSGVAGIAGVGGIN